MDSTSQVSVSRLPGDDDESYPALRVSRLLALALILTVAAVSAGLLAAG